MCKRFYVSCSLAGWFKGCKVRNYKRRPDRSSFPSEWYWQLSYVYVVRLDVRSGLHGCIVAAPIAGSLSDRVVKRAKKERKGIWVPEDRLRAVWVGQLLLIPISVTLAGFTMEYVSGTVGLVITLVCLFFNGAGVSCFSDVSGTEASHLLGRYGSHADWGVCCRRHAWPECRGHGCYFVRLTYPRRTLDDRWSILFIYRALRSLLIAPVSALCIPAVETIGIAATNTIVGVVALLGYGYASRVVLKCGC